MTVLIVIGIFAVVIALTWLLFAPRRHPEVGRSAGPGAVEHGDDVTDE